MSAAAVQGTAGRTGVGGPIREELRGRGVGMMVLSFFGLGWASWGLADGVAAGVDTAITVVAVLCAVAAVVGAVLLFRRSASAPSGADALRARPAGKRFGFIVAAEFIGIFVIARVLAVTGLTELIPAIVCLGVGIHFFPLTRLFNVPIYHYTGGALCLITLATVVLAPLTGQSALWTMLPGLGAALVLFTTSALLFLGVSRRARPA
jgi:hypothetical protein